jgi:hypothetical protein
MTEDTSTPPAVSAAARMRRHRDRRRKKLVCVLIELRETEIDALVTKGLLQQDSRGDPNAVRRGLYAYFDRTLSGIA